MLKIKQVKCELLIQLLKILQVKNDYCLAECLEVSQEANTEERSLEFVVWQLKCIAQRKENVTH